MNPLISSLIEYGTKLSKQLELAKSQPKSVDQIARQERLDGILKEVDMAVHQVLEELESAQLPSFFPETIIPKLHEKILLTLHIFIKVDPTNAPSYDDLAKIVNDSKSKHYPSPSPPPAGHDHVLQHSDSTTHESSDQQQEHPFANLNETEKGCLICFCLFTPGKEIKKREPINLWVGMWLITTPSEGEAILAKLVAQRLVERMIRNKRFCNRYKMNETIWRKVVSVRAFQVKSITPDGPLAILEHPLGTLVLNVSENNISATTFERLPKDKRGDQVLLLGSWDHNYERYIVVEDVDTLKALRNIRNVTYLSLQGVSGLVQLPESVYMLEYLKVLDVRACPNLESISEGIESLKHLKYLDMSECYLLDHIPKGIASLPKLTVLKGFVVIAENASNSSRASFSDLSELDQLLKLSVRTRRMKFPIKEDFETLSSMKVLTNLKIAWAASNYVVINSPSLSSPSDDYLGHFPASLKKLELQAVPQSTMLQVMRLISVDAHISLEKLYIRGSRQFESCIAMRDIICHVHTVRLKYMSGLSICWDDFREIFPDLTRLEVSGCPNLIFFPCGQYGVWEKQNQSTLNL